MSVPTFVASASASQTAAGTGPLACNVPTGTANADLLLAHVAVATGAGVPTAPGGWTFLVSETRAFGNSYLYGRLASSEPASYNWSVSSSSEYSVITHAYRPSSGSWASAQAAIATIETRNVSSSTTQGVPALILPAAIDMMLVTFLALGRGSTTTTKPTGYTLAENPDTGGSTGAATESGGAYLSVTAGSASATSWTTTNSATATTIHLAVIDPGVSQPRTIRHWVTTTNGATGALAAVVPVAAAGDLLVAVVSRTANVAVTPPSGWTSIVGGNLNEGGSDDRTEVFIRTVDGTEGVTATFTAASGTPAWSAGLMALASVTALPAFALANDTGSNTTWNVPALTMVASTPHAIVMAVVVPARADRTVSAVPAGYTSLFSARSSSAAGGSMTALAYKFETGSDPAAVAFTGDAANGNIGVHLGTGLAVAPSTGRASGYILG